MRTTLGIGWRPEIALAIERRADIEFVEVLFENLAGGKIPKPLRSLRERGVTIVPHAVSMSLGGAERPNVRRIKQLNELAVRLESPFVSEHIAFVRAGGRESGHLLPVPRTKAALNILIENILVAKEHLTVPLALENIAALCDWKKSVFDEAEFLSQVLEATDCWLLLDIANLYANSINHHFDPILFLQKLPLHRIAYVHTAGGVFNRGAYHDTHAHPIVDGVHSLLAELLKLTCPPRVMLERDDNFPDEQTLNAELDLIVGTVSRSTYTCSMA